MPLSKDEVLHVARLARLALDDAEVEKFREQLSVILEHAERVMALAAEDVPPTSHAIPLENVLRDDVAGVSLSQEKALSTGPKVEQGRFMVPRIIEVEP